MQYRLSSSDKSVSFTNFQPDKYKVQVYTIKQGDKYAVITFEKEFPFEITTESDSYNENEDNYYLINEVSPKEFRTINVKITTKTPELVSLGMDNIFYNGIASTVGERWNATGAGFDTGTVTSKPIKVQEDISYKGAKQPLDVIVCRFKSKSLPCE